MCVYGVGGGGEGGVGIISDSVIWQLLAHAAYQMLYIVIDDRPSGSMELESSTPFSSHATRLENWQGTVINLLANLISDWGLRAFAASERLLFWDKIPRPHHDHKSITSDDAHIFLLSMDLPNG